MRTCTICGQTAKNPYRRVVAGVVVEGCVAMMHGYVDEWARRSDALAVQAAMGASGFVRGLPAGCPAVTG